MNHFTCFFDYMRGYDYNTEKINQIFFLKPKKIKHWKWKYFSVFFGKLKSLENTEKKLFFKNVIFGYGLSMNLKI